MRVTVLNEGKSVGVDGEFFGNLPFALAQDVHAIQWYGTWGEVEYAVSLVDGRPVKPANTTITDFSAYEYLLPLWQAAKQEHDNIEAQWLAEMQQNAQNTPAVGV